MSQRMYFAHVPYVATYIVGAIDAEQPERK